MKARIVRIGNSRGIRIPKPLIEQAGLEDDVEIVVQGNALVISPVGRPRAGWAEAFRAMAAHGDDVLLDGTQSTRWDEDDGCPAAFAAKQVKSSSTRSAQWTPLAWRASLVG